MRQNTLVTKILELSREDPSVLQQLERFRCAVTVMFTDIKGSTEYFESFGDIAGLAMVHECNDLLRAVIEQHGGRVVKTMGDAVMAVFDDCEKSTQSAISIQRRLRERNAVRKKQDEMLVRIGMHYGMGIVKSDDVFGDVVNTASRVESVAQPGQIIVSDSLKQQLPPAQFKVVLLGRYRLKGKSEERDLYQVVWGDTEPVRVEPAHTKISHAGVSTAKLQQLHRDGTVAAEFAIDKSGMTVGGTEADLQSDAKSQGVRARFSLEDGQPTVEDVGKKGRIFIRLLATYDLEEGDIIAMGTRLFRFVCKPDIVAAATTLGKTLLDVGELLQEWPAEFVGINPDGSERHETYPLQQEEVTFGRTKGTFTFNNDGVMSRSHARVYHRGEDFFLEDLGSRNGTFVMVRGKAPVPVGASVLVAGQVFRIVQ
ncbi:MAG TPA: adenylate/guanylate cyclase domain-containing protein [Terriglobales bacterium]|nr:adenylate/guanylate cyclase domain-containing protein [Terriglobales bacterium]